VRIHPTDYKYWIFDLDHTLMNFDKSSQKAFYDTCDYFEIENNRLHFFSSFTKNSFELWKQLESGKITRDFLRLERFKKIFAEFKYVGDANSWSKKYLEGLCSSADFYDGAIELVRYLKNDGIQIGVITNGIGHVQKARLSGSFLLEASDFILTSDPPFRPKPAPDLFLEALSKWSPVSPEQVLMVGDNFQCDVLGASSVGMGTCWLANEEKWNENPNVTDFYFSSIKKLYETVTLKDH